MATHKEVQDWYEHWFGAQRDANSQNAIAALHHLLGTDTAKLEDKQVTGSLRKTLEGDN